MFVDFINNSSTSGAIVFYDVCSAFATLLRRIAFDIDLGDEHWLNSLITARLSHDDVSHIYDFVEASFFDNLSAMGCNLRPSKSMFTEIRCELLLLKQLVSEIRICSSASTNCSGSEGIIDNS